MRGPDLEWVERSWRLLGRLMKLHALVYRATRGLLGHRFPGLPGMLLLDHVGQGDAAARKARDGDPRSG